MSVSRLSSVPRTEFRGVKDETVTNLTLPVENLPIRLPLFQSFAPWGEYGNGRYVNDSGLSLLFGSGVTDPLSPFFTHQSQFIRSHFEASGKAIFVRLPAPGATQASFRLALDIVEDLIPLYERNTDGSLKLDAQGAKIPTGETATGHRAQWRWKPVGKTAQGESTFGAAAEAEGLLVSTVDGAVSKEIPIWDGLARFEGEKGNNIGMRLIAPTTKSQQPADEDLADTLGARLYRVQFVNRANKSSTATLQRTLRSQPFLDFSFKKGTIDLATSTEYYGGKVIKKNYEANNPQAFTGWGPCEKFAFYDTNIQALLTTLATAESDYTTEEFKDVNLFNFLTGTDINGNPYHTFVIEGPADGGILLGELSNLWMTGGADGDLGNDSFNAVMDTVLTDLSSNGVPYKDIARMPYDSVWDSGFPVATKLKFSAFHTARPDVYVHTCTQDVMKPLNTPAQDSSIAITLRSHFRAQQESSEFGTKALRFCVFGQAGYLIDDLYDGIVPFLEYILILGTEYMGAEGGEMKNEKSFGRGEQNTITRYRDHNVVTQEPEVRQVDWDNGMNYAEYFDMGRLFWAGIQSIYEEQTSILHAYINVCIACNLTRIGHITWREMSGDSQLTDEQFLDMVNDKVTARTAGKYDGRVDVTPDAYFDAFDTQSNFSWHLNIEMAGDNARTVENLAIIAQNRRSSET